MKRKHIKIVCVLCVLISIILGIGIYANREKPLLVVNGEEIWQEEYDFYLKHYKKELEAKNMEQKNEFILYRKIEQQLAVEKAGVDSFQFEALKERMQEKNAENKEKKKNGEPVYGLLTYDLERYYQYEYNNAVLKLKEALYEGELQADLEEKRKYYEEHEEMFRGQIEGIYYLFSGENSEEVEKTLLEVKENKMGISDVPDSVEIRVLEMNQENLRTLEKAEQQIAAELLKLKEKEWSSLLDNGYQYRLLYCQTRKEGAMKEFEEVEMLIQERIGDIKYDEYIKTKREKADIIINV